MSVSVNKLAVEDTPERTFCLVAVARPRVLEITDLGFLYPVSAHAWRLAWRGGRVAGHGQA